MDFGIATTVHIALLRVIFESNPTPQLPCLLVNIGSGVSVIKIGEDGTFERASGTSLGGWISFVDLIIDAVGSGASIGQFYSQPCFDIGFLFRTWAS